MSMWNLIWININIMNMKMHILIFYFQIWEFFLSLKFQRIGIWEILHSFSYDHTYRKLILHNPSYDWLSPNNSKNNYLIFKPNILTSFLIVTSLLFLTRQLEYGYEKTNQYVHFHIHDIYINPIKFDIGINNDDYYKCIVIASVQPK
jgi:hypothetical protein